MISVFASFDHDGISSLVVDGHDPRQPSGKSVLCAAVSGILLSLEIGLVEVLEQPARVQTRSGHTTIELIDEIEPMARVLVLTALRTLQTLQAQYADDIKLEIKPYGT